jgi:nucleotide-binding universal stress UspA family protein
MYSSIVVGTDGSDTAGVAVAHATDLASRFGATLHVVHAYRAVSAGDVVAASSGGVVMPDLISVNEGIKATSEAVLQRTVHQAETAGVKIQTHAVSGDAADALILTAEEVGADLIVVGNRGMSGMKRFVLGSVPNKVSHHCPCSVLIVNTATGAGAE